MNSIECSWVRQLYCYIFCFPWKPTIWLASVSLRKGPSYIWKLHICIITISIYDDCFLQLIPIALEWLRIPLHMINNVKTVCSDGPERSGSNLTLINSVNRILWIFYAVAYQSIIKLIKYVAIDFLAQIKTNTNNQAYGACDEWFALKTLKMVIMKASFNWL